jgi:hypothetical protein
MEERHEDMQRGVSIHEEQKTILFDSGIKEY